MRHVVWGTAGHIDHGKTTLVKALTGTDCDRLPEEQERGITIDLGFAQLSDQGMQLHFVDVPGHDRLVHTMIAGASGIDLALLVVAADEGVMPQTREHLDVIRLMGVPGGAVALTKIDLLDEELVELASAEVRQFLASTDFAGVPVVPVSGSTGSGVHELRNVLFEQARKVRPRQLEGRPFREPIDRVFSLTGAGTIITGTSLWGTLEVGSEITVLPRSVKARVRRLHVHGEERRTVEAGERVAINLAGVSREEVDRGDQVISPGPWRPTRMATVKLELLSTAPGPLDEGDEVEVHALAARVAGRIERIAVRPLPPGGRAVTQISLSKPLLLFPGDRLVLRRPSPVNTFAGGRVLDAELSPRGPSRSFVGARTDSFPSDPAPHFCELIKGRRTCDIRRRGARAPAGRRRGLGGDTSTRFCRRAPAALCSTTRRYLSRRASTSWCDRALGRPGGPGGFRQPHDHERRRVGAGNRRPLPCRRI
jgi:selenocysteine-specific elongation factor